MRILLIEDDKELCKFVAFQLKEDGYSVDICNHGGEAIYYIEKQVYNLIILDRMLPETDGLTILKNMRASGIVTPVIMVTAMSSITDRIDGLDTGADDYLVKPFASEELFARVRALVRRPQKLEITDKICVQDMELDMLNKTLSCHSKSIELSKRELDLLEFFMKNNNQTLTRELLLDRVWGPDSFVEDGNLDTYIYFLRRRIKNIGSQVVIKTIRSVGYCMESK